MHQPTLLKWADLLGPLFPSGAAVDLRPQQNRIAVSWVQRETSDTAPPRNRIVAIQISPAAIKGYRNAQRGQQARADRKLFALVHSSLKQCPPGAGAGVPEIQIEVASGDILPR